jgi:hypothetical protein
MPKIESERGAEAAIIAFLVKFMDEAGLIRSDAFAQKLREWANEGATGAGQKYMIDVANAIDGKGDAEVAKPSLN